MNPVYHFTKPHFLFKKSLILLKYGLRKERQFIHKQHKPYLLSIFYFLLELL